METPESPTRGKTWEPRGEDGGPHCERGLASESRVKPRCHVVRNTCLGHLDSEGQTFTSFEPIGRQGSLRYRGLAHPITVRKHGGVREVGMGNTPDAASREALCREMSGAGRRDVKFQAAPRTWAADGTSAAGADE